MPHSACVNILTACKRRRKFLFPHLFVKKLGWDNEQFFYLCAGLLD